MQETGTVENAEVILAANGLGFADGLPSEMTIPENLIQNNKILSYYRMKDIQPGARPGAELEGIGISELGINFEVG